MQDQGVMSMLQNSNDVWLCIRKTLDSFQEVGTDGTFPADEPNDGLQSYKSNDALMKNSKD